MELRKEYKQTEVGVIPKDWHLKNIAATSSLKARIGWQGLTTSEYLSLGDYFLVTGTDFFNGKIKWETCHYVNKDRFIQDKNIQVKVGDILITKDGTIGKVAYVDILPLDATLNSGVFVIRPKDNAYDPLYCYYIFNSAYFDDFLRKLVAGSTINHLYQKDFILFNFPLPPTIAEQKAIANALSDADDYINNLEKLIEKKRNIKQGAMQELLMPKNGWVEKKLGEILRLQGGYAFKSTSFIESGVPIIRISDVGEGVVSLVNCVHYEEFNIPSEYIVASGDVLIAMSGATTGKIGVYRQNEKAYINQRVGKFIVWDNKKTSLEFISHFLNSEKFKIGLAKEIAQGAQPNISGKQIESIEIEMPLNFMEQNEIATILSDLDNEITSLEKKLSKIKMLKQGMMQELLTGKIRLV